jgi:ubiquinone/menaquinone biosynthesis C-methylase UbiE
MVMGVYHDRVLPFLLHLAMSNRELVPYRQRTIAQARGQVLEVGIGSGLNLPFYDPAVPRIHGVDPLHRLLERVAREGARAPLLVHGSAETLPYETAAFDTVVTTWTLCSIPDVLAALREMRRVLRNDGRLLFVEHGRGPDAAVARWQDRLTPCWKCLGGGCHLNRRIDDLIGQAGFHIDHMAKGYLRGRNPFTFMYEGVARPAR